MKSILPLIASALIFVSPLTSHAQDLTPYGQMPAGLYEVDPTHASLVFKVSHLGLADYTARFNKFSADLQFDPAAPEKSSVKAVIDPTSIDTGFPHKDKKDFNAELASGENWFNAGAYPKITFTSTEILKTGENSGIMKGILHMLGTKHPVALNVTFNGSYASKPFADVPALGFSAHGKFKRSNWGFGTYIPAIGDEIEILIEAEFHKVQ